MSNIVKHEINRAFWNKNFLISCLIGTLLVLWYSVERIPFCMEKNVSIYSSRIADEFLEVSFLNWIGSHNIYLQQNIFYVILPILAVIPFGGTFYTDIKEGYIKNICIRTKKSHYLLAKYVSVFLSGGCAVVFPMILSFFISSAFLPSVLPEVSYLFTNIFSVNKWADVLFTAPYLCESGGGANISGVSCLC